MDSVTHLVFGAALGEAILGRRVGKKAMLLGALANSIPDLDVLLVFGDPIREVTIHRGFSHSFLFPFLVAPLLAWLSATYIKDVISFKHWFWFYVTLVLAHPLLDSLTTYGTQFFLPFSDYRINSNSLFIIDFFFTLPMLVGVIACLIMSNANAKRRVWNFSGLAAAAFYVVLGFVCKAQASHVFDIALKEKQISSTHRMTGVTPFNILLWYTVAEVDSGYFTGDYSLLDSDSKIPFHFIPRNEKILSNFRTNYGIERMIWFSNGFYSVEKVGQQIRFFPLKFGLTGFDVSRPLSQSVPFYYGFTPQSDGRLKTEMVNGFDKLNLSKTLKQLWNRILGNKQAFQNKN